MKRYLFLFVLIVFLCGSCTKKEFFINFSLPENVDVNLDAVYYADSPKGGATVQGVAPIIGGKCSFHGITILPTVVLLTNRSCKVPIVVYAEGGSKIDVKGDTVNPYTWNFGGNQINRDLSQWRNANSEVLSKALHRDVNEAVEKYVRENPGNPVSALLLLTNFYRADNEKLFLDLWHSLQGEAKDEKWANLVARSDIISGNLRYPAVLKSMAMRAFPEGLDTISTVGNKATLLTFRNTMPEGFKALSDSMRILTKEFKDSSNWLIADICLDPDSLGWRSKLRSDTIEEVSRLWSPFGLTDPVVMKLGVYQLPFFIVLTSEGIQEYRGSVADSAFNTFRQLIRD